MTDATITPNGPRIWLRTLWKDHRVWLASFAIVVLLTIFDSQQAAESTGFAVSALLHTAPYLLLSIAIAAWAGATGADNLIAKAFVGAPLLMIGLEG